MHITQPEPRVDNDEKYASGNAQSYNHAKRIKKQLKAALKECLEWDDPNVPYREKVVNGDVLYAAVKSIVKGID